MAMPPIPMSGEMEPEPEMGMGMLGPPTAPGAMSGYAPEPPPPGIPPMGGPPPDRFIPRERTYRSSAHHEKHEKKSKHAHPQRGKKKKGKK